MTVSRGNHAYLQKQTLTPAGYVVEYKSPDDALLEPRRMDTLKSEQQMQDREPQSVLTPLGYWMCFTAREIPEIPGWDRAAAIAEEDAILHRGLVQHGLIPP